MNIGVFVSAVAPASVAQARFQEAVMEGLARLSVERHKFYILCGEVPPNWRPKEPFVCVELASESGLGGRLVRLKAALARFLLGVGRIWGVSGGGTFSRLQHLANPEPAYFRQLHELDIRLIWNMNQHEIASPLPYIRTIWDVNHRIHPTYPEFSYTRYGFDGCDTNMANSLARASYVITGTEEGKQQVAQIYGVFSGKIRVIPLPTPELPQSGNTKPSVSLPLPSPYIFYPARFWPHKNHVVIIEALKVLRQKFNLHLNCVFSGPDEGNLEYVLQRAKQAGVKEQIMYVGRVVEEDLAHLYANAFALVYASAVGPDNLPPLEAMSLGCPVITANVPGSLEQYGQAALFFDPLKEEQLAEHLAKLFNDPSFRANLIERGHRRATAFTVEDYARKVVEIVDEFALIARAWEKGDSVFT